MNAALKVCIQHPLGQAQVSNRLLDAYKAFTACCNRATFACADTQCAMSVRTGLKLRAAHQVYNECVYLFGCVELKGVKRRDIYYGH